MRGTADRQKLAESLDDPKDQRLKHGHRKRAKEYERDGDPGSTRMAATRAWSPTRTENERDHGDDHRRLQQPRSTTLPAQYASSSDETERNSGEHDDRERRTPHRERCEGHHEQCDGSYHDKPRYAGPHAKWKRPAMRGITVGIVEILGDLAGKMKRHANEKQRDARACGSGTPRAEQERQ